MRLYLLQLGLMANGVPVPGYLIRAGDGTHVLVDSGFAARDYRDADPQHWARITERDWVVNRLAAIGVAPGDVRYLVCSHLDPDHAGSHDAFPDAELVVQRAHLEVARSRRHARFQQTRAHWDHPQARWRRVDGDAPLLPGIELIESGGHVPGHQSVLVRLPQTGPVLLAIDAIPRRLGDHAPEDRPPGPFDLDVAGARASTRKLVDLAAREGALLVHGHDPDQWRRLKQSPDFYA